MFNADNIVFSLIMATYNRKDEVDSFINSIVNQNFDVNKIELIIVDQNKDELLTEVVEKYSSKLNIKHIKSEVLGLSVSRNIGIDKAQGEILSFPDDDCEYYKDTLQTVYSRFISDQNLITLLGQIIDYSDKKVFRNWPNKEIEVTKNNFYTLNSSITLFTKSILTRFDEKLGLGNKFGSCEDADYLYSVLNRSKEEKVQYDPQVKVYHPHPNLELLKPKKVVSYGLGFGGFCKKNRSSPILFLYCKVTVYQMVMLILAVVKMNRLELRRRFLSLRSIIKGYIIYK